MMLRTLCALVLPLVCQGAVQADQLKQLPGWGEALPSDMYSGT